MSDVKNASTDTPRSESYGIVHSFQGLPEPVKVAIGVGAGLSILFVPLAIYFFGGAIWRVLVIFFWAGAVLGTMAGIAFLLSLSKQKKQERTQKTREAEQVRQNEMSTLQRQRSEMLTAILEGKTNPMSDPGSLLLRNSEAVWHSVSAQVLDKRSETYWGELYVTSLRLVFTCPEFPIEIPISHINAVESLNHQLSVTGRTANYSHVFWLDDPEVAAAHIRRAVLVYHRQVDVGFESDSSRRIPQDVKTAVYQRDKGRCVQCGATDYLEFDHIIPFSKGGANTVDNIQLLCRRCNLRKSNSI